MRIIVDRETAQGGKDRNFIRQYRCMSGDIRLCLDETGPYTERRHPPHGMECAIRRYAPG